MAVPQLGSEQGVLSVFIAFEGGEGSGKSTQVRGLARRLAKAGVPVVAAREPGGTRLGAHIRRWLKWGRPMDSRAELLLFAASRAQLVAEVLRPALERGAVVVCDRFTDSTLAYQAGARGLDSALIRAANEMATAGLSPDLVVLLDLPPQDGLRRKKPRRQDRFEREGLAFHTRVREAYLTLARADPERWLIVDASLPKRRAADIIWRRVQELLAKAPKNSD